MMEKNKIILFGSISACVVTASILQFLVAADLGSCTVGSFDFSTAPTVAGATLASSLVFNFSWLFTNNKPLLHRLAIVMWSIVTICGIVAAGATWGQQQFVNLCHASKYPNSSALQVGTILLLVVSVGLAHGKPEHKVGKNVDGGTSSNRAKVIPRDGGGLLSGSDGDSDDDEHNGGGGEDGTDKAVEDTRLVIDIQKQSSIAKDLQVKKIEEQAQSAKTRTKARVEQRKSVIHLNKLKEKALKLVTRKQLKRAFNRHDMNFDGDLDEFEICMWLDELLPLQKDVDDEQLNIDTAKKIIESYDADGDQKIQFDELVTWFQTVQEWTPKERKEMTKMVQVTGREGPKKIRKRLVRRRAVLFAEAVLRCESADVGGVKLPTDFSKVVTQSKSVTAGGDMVHHTLHPH